MQSVPPAQAVARRRRPPGTKRGLKVGMELVVTDPHSALNTVKITKVEHDRSEAVLTQMLDVATGPAAGWRVSTRGPWHSRTK
jgi:hypothetical protein